MILDHLTRPLPTPWGQHRDVPAVGWSTPRVVVLVAAVGLVAGAIGSVLGGLSSLLLKADARAVSASLAANTGSGNLNLRSANDLNLTAQHVRVVGRDGNFELEHSPSVAASTLTAFSAGTSTRTPIQIGAGDQDVLSLVVSGRQGQTNDLQEWSTNGKPLLAVDGRGRLRFGDVTLWAVHRNGRITFYAQAPGEPPRVLSRTAG